MLFCIHSDSIKARNSWTSRALINVTKLPRLHGIIYVIFLRFHFLQMYPKHQRSLCEEEMITAFVLVSAQLTVMLELSLSYSKWAETNM